MVKIKKNSMNQCGREGKETHTPVLQCQLQPLRQSLNTVILRNPDVCVYFLVVFISRNLVYKTDNYMQNDTCEQISIATLFLTVNIKEKLSVLFKLWSVQ